MIKLLTAARQLQEFCDSRGWQSCFIGGIAVQRWGEPRITRDLDLTLFTGFGEEDHFTEALLTEYAARIEDAAGFARRYRTLLIATAGGAGIDVALGALPFEKEMIRRASLFSFGPGLEVRTCSAEDLIVLKLFASRPLDIRDAEGVVLRHRLDWDYIEEHLTPLAEVKGDPAILQSLSRLRQMSQSE